MFRKKKAPEPVVINPKGAAAKVPPRQKRWRPIVLGLLALLLVAAAVGGYIWYKRRQAEKIPTIVFEGKEYPAPFLTEEYRLQNPANLQPDRNQEAEELEKKIAASGGSFDDYLALAQIYDGISNKQKAIESYRKARQLADPKMDYYDSVIKSIDDSIKRLEES